MNLFRGSYVCLFRGSLTDLTDLTGSVTGSVSGSVIGLGEIVWRSKLGPELVLGLVFNPIRLLVQSFI